MKMFDRVNTDNLERRELHLSIFVAVIVMMLALGTGFLMYPVVFSYQGPGDRTMHIAFFGYCGLCVLLTIYLWERHATIRQQGPGFELADLGSTNGIYVNGARRCKPVAFPLFPARNVLSMLR